MSNLKQKRFVDTDYFHEQLDSTTVEVEGSHISATETKIGYLKDIEILGNTIQDASNLADIRSVGDKVEGQELYEIPIVSCGKNLFNIDTCVNGKILSGVNGEIQANASWFYTDFIKVKAGVTYRMGAYKQPFDPYYSCLYSKDKTFIKSNIGEVFTPSENGYVRLSGIIENKDKGQLEESAIVTPYEPYQEDKLTILSPVQLEKVGDVADRIIEKDGVWGVEKNVKSITFSGEESWFKAVNKNTSLPPEYRLTNAISDYKLFGAYGKGISNKYSFIGNQENCWVSTKEGFGLGSSAHKGTLYVCCNVATLDEFKTHINKFSVKYIVETPQFIPLPHSQQVKLRTFANKTNISFLT
jgi:hypothetical protein